MFKFLIIGMYCKNTTVRIKQQILKISKSSLLHVHAILRFFMAANLLHKKETKMRAERTPEMKM